MECEFDIYKLKAKLFTVVNNLFIGDISDEENDVNANKFFSHCSFSVSYIIYKIMSKTRLFHF